MSRFMRIEDLNSRYQGAYLPSQYYPPTQSVLRHQTTVAATPHYVNKTFHSVIDYPSTNSQIIEIPSKNMHGNQTMNSSITRRVVANPIGVTSTKVRRYEVLEPIAQQQQNISRIEQKDRQNQVSKKNERPLSISREKQNVSNDPPPPPTPPSLGMRSRTATENAGIGGFCGKCSACFSGRCLAWVCLPLCLLVVVPLIVLTIYLRRSNTVTPADLSNPSIPFSNPIVDTQLISQTDRDFANQINIILARQLQARNLNKMSGPNMPPGFINPNDPHSGLQPPSPPFGPNNSGFPQINNMQNDRCRAGFFFYQGKCLSCPDDSLWNGTDCIKYVVVNRTKQVENRVYHLKQLNLNTYT